MSDLQFSPYSDSFGRFVSVSVSIHVAVLAAILFKTAFFPNEQIDVRHAIRVDIVGLPDKVKAVDPGKSVAPAPKPVAVPAKVEKPPAPAVKVEPKKVETKDLKANQKKALEKLKALSAIDKLNKELAEKAEQNRNERTFKGNAMSSGDSLSGLEQIAYDRYFSEVEGKVRDNWNLPSWLAEKDLRAKALVLIDSGGFVTKRQIVASSGNEVFDTQVLDTVDRTSPFPAPPPHLKDVLALKGIIFNFPD